MPNQKKDAEAALKKLGHHLRFGWSKQYSVSDKSLESVRATIREQWELEQKTKSQHKPSQSKNKAKVPRPPEPEI